MKKYEEFLPEVRVVADKINKKDLSSIRETALVNWLNCDCKHSDPVAKAWVNATIIVLIANGFEIKKKD